MNKYCYNYESGEYEWIDENGFSMDRGEYVYNWDRSQFREEEERNLTWSWNHDDDMNEY